MQERNGGKGKSGFKTKEEAVADAWQKAKEEAEEVKRKQWEARRGTRQSVDQMPGLGQCSPLFLILISRRPTNCHHIMSLDI